MSSSFYYYSGILASIYSVYAWLTYYTLSGVSVIDASTAKLLIARREISSIIDVRTKPEWDIGHHPSAIHIPLNTLNSQTVIQIPKKEGLLIYCNTGQRARRAAEVMKQLGFADVYYIPGSYKTIM